MRAIGIRHLMLVVACAAAMISAGSSYAQEKPDDVDFIGVPEYLSTETEILFFHEQLAHGVDRWFDEIRKAIKSCDRASYDEQVDSMKRVAGYYKADAADTTYNDIDAKERRRLRQDAENLAIAITKVPPFPKDCRPPDAGKPATPPTPAPTPTPTPAPGAKLPDCVANDPEVKAANAAYDATFSEWVKAAGDLADAMYFAKVAAARARVDQASAALDAAIKRAEERCAEKKRTGMRPLDGAQFGFFALGGSNIGLGGSGNVTGVSGGAASVGDSFAVVSDVPSSNRTAYGGSSSATFDAGLRARLTASFAKLMNEPGRATRESAPEIFLETGVQSAFGAQSFSQSFQGVSAPQAFGSSAVKENVQIPILIGAGLPLGSPTAGSPIFLDLYGGLTLSSWSQTLQGRESGAPTGAGFFGQSNRFTVDPTVGVGLRTSVGAFTVGVNAEFQFRPGSVVTAGSPNFAGQTYYGTVDPHTNLLLMGRIGWSFGRP